MNFIAHFYVDKHVDDGLFFVGVSTPDWVSIFDRNVRVKANLLPLIMENEATPAELSFYNGVMRHLEIDRDFHSSEFFAFETQEIMRLIDRHLGKERVPRSFFVAHVLFELVLDKVLIQSEPSLLPTYYRHLESCSLKRMVQLTEWITSTPLPGYDAFLQRFIAKRYLYQYTDWDHLIYVLRRILERVRLRQVEYLYEPAFMRVLQEYEEGLIERHAPYMAAFGRDSGLRVSSASCG